MMRMHKIIGLVVIVLLFIPLLTHYYLTKVGVEEPKPEQENSPWISQLADVDKLTGADLKYRIEELVRIKYSVSGELRELEAKRQRVQTDIATLNRKLDDAKNEAGRRRNELDRLQISLQQAKVAEKEAMERNTPRMGRPKPLSPLRSIPVHPSLNDKSNNRYCNMDSCFDYSLCPLSSRFRFYLYPYMFSNLSFISVPETNNINISPNYYPYSGPTVEILHQMLSRSIYTTRDPTRACLFILLVDICDPQKLSQLSHQLPNWYGDGRNHVIWLDCGIKFRSLFTPQFMESSFGRSMIASENSIVTSFRDQFDLVVPNWEKAVPSGEIWSQLPPIVPAKRKYLATYLGGETDQFIQLELLKIQQEDPLSFVFQFSCNTVPYSKNAKSEENEVNSAIGGDKSARNLESYTQKKLSSLCENDLLRTRLLLDSTFSLIILPSEDIEILSSNILQLRLYESLKYGAIPVAIGTRFIPPFNEVIDWTKLMLFIPSSRVTEMHYILKSFGDADLIEMRKRGRLVFQKYFSTLENIADSFLAVLRTRIGIPATPYKDVSSPSVFNDSFVPQKLDSFTIDPEEEENLGPIEPPYPSPAFTRNYSSIFLHKYELWNTYYQPTKLYPYTPWDPVMPSEAKFRGSALGFRPISSGAGGSGKEFSESLGGNLPKEQFTVVMLTFEREQVLMNSLQRLFALPYLNKVIVVWNSQQPPTPDLKWPDIGVPVHVVKADKNSLNNRFLPFDIIETEAVLSIDDDAHLRHDEIVFGFRVWRENRDRVVGFPGRFHALDQNNFGNWLYNSNYSCELSMVLTGAAFYHKIYSYLYTYEMPGAIREKVDELMNCEDIAMNFLVSHVTGKPPVKVTSRWTFRCPGCPVTLSEDDSHFQERHHCINFFSKVYGYTPLLYTQFRADSILFKTRIPHDKQKCFKYI